jgi:hypothetical protein
MNPWIYRAVEAALFTALLLIIGLSTAAVLR